MSQEFQIPTRSASREWLRQAWTSVCDLQPLNDDERRALFDDLRIAKETNGDWNIQRQLVNAAYERHLKERPWWHWGEYEYWRRLYFSGLQPTGFHPDRDPYAMTQAEDIYEYASLPMLKKALSNAGIASPKKDVTRSVAEMVRNDGRLFLEAKRIVCLAIKDREFTVFLRTLDSRATSLETAKRAESRKVPLQLCRYEPRLEKGFLDAALKRNPRQVPPFWPGAPNYWESPMAERIDFCEEFGIDPPERQ